MPRTARPAPASRTARPFALPPALALALAILAATVLAIAASPVLT